MDPAGAQTSPRTPAGAQDSPPAPAGAQDSPQTPAGAQDSPRTPAGAQDSPRTPAGAQDSPRTPAGAQDSPRTPAGAQNSPRTPAGAQDSPRTPAGAQDSPRTPAGAQDSPRTLQVLSCLNQFRLKPWDCGLWDETQVPSALRGIVEPQRYLQAVQRINKVHRKKVRFRSDCAQHLLTVVMVTSALLGTFGAIVLISQTQNMWEIVGYVVGLVSLYAEILTFRKQERKRILRELTKAVGGANSLLWEEHVLIGCGTISELALVSVRLSGCREDLGRRFDAALVKFSCAYAWCLAQGRVPFAPRPDEPGHLSEDVCFCQYVRRLRGSSCC